MDPVQIPIVSYGFIKEQNTWVARTWVQVTRIDRIFTLNFFRCVEVKMIHFNRLVACLLPLSSRVRVSATQRGFCGGRNGVWVGFSRGFSRFPLSQISFHNFFTPISSVSSADVIAKQTSLLFTDLQYRFLIASHTSTRPCALCRTRGDKIILLNLTKSCIVTKLILIVTHKSTIISYTINLG